MELIRMVCSIYCFLIGMCVASFMNVVIDRVPRGENFVSGRSHCDSCGKVIAWYDLIPVVSYLVLRGRCRYCHCKIPVRGFFIEIFGGLIGVFCFYRFGFEYETILMFVIAMILLAITMIDFDTMIIPDGLNMVMFLVCLVLMFVRQMSLVDSIIGMFCISLPMFLLNLVIPDSFGGGDIKLMFAGGIALGWKYSLLAAFIGILIAGIYCIYLILTKKVDKKGHIAFGPYLSIGIFIALCYGYEIVSWYLNLLM